ncbi:MAG: YtxH domain-containing protein [Bacteroidetes bacterium]|nr:YtxH domain-containing protein [Bacteroidota bacterium]
MKNPLGLLLLGAAVGAAVGILMAPDKGTKTRKKIFEGAEGLTEELKDKIRLSNKRIDEYAEAAEEALEKINKKLKAAERSYS